MRDCVEILRRSGDDSDENIAQLAIEIYTRRNEVCYAAAGSKTLRVNSEPWHELIDYSLAGI